MEKYFCLCLDSETHLPEHSLDIDNGLGVCHVVLLGAHGAFLVHDHQVVCVDYTTLEEVVQAGHKTLVYYIRIY